MSTTSPVLHLLCGKIASGKSTLAERLSRGPGTVVIAEDAWLHALYGDQMASIADYVCCTGKLRGMMGPHIAAVLRAGTSVVLDFQANTVEARGWMREILDQTAADHVLHVFDVPDEVCLARLRARNAQGDHPFAVTEAQFHQISSHFCPPSAEEGFHIRHHGVDPGL